VTNALSLFFLDAWVFGGPALSYRGQGSEAFV